jgi:polyketide biosynthesis enoyl-CoA hydratase PksI
MALVEARPHEPEGVFLLRIDDAARNNRLSEELCGEWMAALRALAAEPTLKVLLLAGRRDVFCAGATREVLREIAAGRREVKDLEMPALLLGFPVPIVAALEGHAVGGGLAVALCCDVLVASKSSRYGVNFTELGFTPGMGTMGLLPAAVGHHFAAEMILTGKLFKGEELRGRGLFNHVVDGDRVFETASAIAARMADRPRRVLELVKGAMALPRRRALLEATSSEALMHRACFAREETLSIIESNYLDNTGGTPWSGERS